MTRNIYSGEEIDPDQPAEGYTRTRQNRRRDDADRARQDNERAEQVGSGRRHRNPSSRSEAESGLPRWIARPIAFLTDKKTKSVVGIALVLLSCYLTVAALSFFRSGANDQSHAAVETISQMASSPEAIDNIGGPVGATVSHHLFIEGMGLGSIALIVYMFIIGLSLLNFVSIKFWSLTFKALIIAITASSVLGLLTLNSSGSFSLGGYHGHYINEYLIARIGWIGDILVNCFLVAVIVVIYISQLTAIYRKSREKMRILQAKKTMLNDREAFIRNQVSDALTDGPIATGNGDMTAAKNDVGNDSAEDNVAEVRVDTGDVVGSFNDIVSDNGFEDIESGEGRMADDDGSVVITVEDNSQGSDVEKAEDVQKANAGIVKEENSVDTGDPSFSVRSAEAIEQGSGKTVHNPVDAQGPYDPRAELSRYRMPSLDLLAERPRKASSVDLSEQEENKERITKALNQYGIEIVKIEATVGPTVTLYEIIPAEGVRIARIKSLEDDIAMSIAALGIRIIAPIPGKGTIGIEVPNKDPQTVSIKSILGSKAFQECKYDLPMAMGATISNDVYIADLTKMPHLLVAGATGQGKSVGLNTIIASLLYKRHPSELKFVLVDPKMVEFSLYARLEKHYLAKLSDAEDAVITDSSKVVDTLNSLCVEMDNRYALLKDAGCRSLKEYNEKFINRRLNPEKGHRYLPFIVMIVDEFADLIMMAGKSVETPIARIAQKARAVGMHLIIATQRPSTNVITGMIKANFPGRMAFRVQQMVDSRTILDSPGAEHLIGRGDMLISTGGAVERVQCAFIDTPEVDAICRHIDDQIGFPTAYILPDPPTESSEGGAIGSLSERDLLFEEIARLVVQGNTASTSNIQRRYSIGYNRAGKIMDQLEAAGIVGAAQGGKPRQVLVDPMQLEMILDSL